MTEVSVVLPCLNEIETIDSCLEMVQQTLVQNGIDGEVIVSDNGSTDGSLEIARKRGARIISVKEKGYGHALMGGISGSRGKFIIMGDADGSYDFSYIPDFLKQLMDGHDIVMGCRFPSGGGYIEKGAMPFLHKWFGNPFFSLLARLMFGTEIHDVYCGLRGFTRSHYERLVLKCTGMEFAIEMVIKSSLMKADFAEIPIRFLPDKRINGKPHLRTFSDGWRTLRLFLLYCPTG